MRRHIHERRINMDIVIREIEEKDYPAVTAILVNDLWNNKISGENAAIFFDKVKNDENYKTFVAFQNNNAVGIISTVTTISAAFASATMLVQGFVVQKEFQNKGIGKKLLQYTEDYAESKGVFGIGLQSGVQRTAAHAFYEHNGYIRSNYFYKNF